MDDRRPPQPIARPADAPTASPIGTDYRPMPRFAWHRSQMPWLTRLSWGWLLVGCVLLLAAGLYVKPDPRGHSTHEQLGFAPCGFYLMTGYPCPTCGATTAFAWMVQGHPWTAVKVQPFGGLAALITAALLAMSFVGIVTAGVPAIRLSRRASVGLALGFLALFVGSWLYKVLAMTAAR
jgi:hypothetical protein